MIPQTVEFLEANGPTPVIDLQSELTIHDREAGVCTFVLRGNPSSRMGGPVTTIAYLADDHDRTAVLRAFYDANPGFVEAKSLRYVQRLIGDYGRQWKDANRTIATEYFDPPEQRREEPMVSGDRDCPLCGEAIAFNQFPQHVARECEAANG